MTTTVTKESLAARIAELESGARSLKEDYTLAAYKMLLATMEAEPVAWTDAQELRDVDRGGCGYLFTVNPVTPHADERRIILLYRHAQPAPVVPDDAKLRELFDSWFASDCSFDLSPEASEADNIAWRESYWYVWQRCRAAMFNGGKP